MPFDYTGDTERPNILANRHVVAAGHYMSAQAGLQILEAGGNAIDAGVAVGIATGVLETGYVSFAGVAPIILFWAETGDIITISGLGPWPKAASCEYFQSRYGGKIPQGIARTVVPAAPDAWITALEMYGTMSFADVAAPAVRFAKDGFPMYPRMARLIQSAADRYRSYPTSAALFLRDGDAPAIGEQFRQVELGDTIQFMIDQEAAHKTAGRLAGLRAARAAFYTGDIARTLVDYHRANEGLLTMEDLAGFRVGIEPPVGTRFGDIDLYGCGPWCQGPMLLQALNLLKGTDLKGMGHNSVAYIHTVIEALKLAAADREAYYGDPRFIDVPMDELLSDAYSERRRTMIRPTEAWPGLPPAGQTRHGKWPSAPFTPARRAPGPVEDDECTYDTSYFCVVDGKGNAFSATPSDGSRASPIIPGLGFVASSRGAQSWTDPKHPSCLAPGKRPRLTTNPALAMRQGEAVMPFGTPGGDVQTQAMLQFFLNLAVFNMNLQMAVEKPRFATYSFPSTATPHDYRPGLVNLEGKLDRAIGESLAKLGHKIEWWPDRDWKAGSVCAIHRDSRTGMLQGAADPRRTAYAVGW